MTSTLALICVTFIRQEIVIIGFGATLVICLGLTLFAFQTKIDFTLTSGILFVALLTFVLFGIMTAGLRFHYETLNIVYCGLGVLIYSFYLVYDTQLMMGGRHRYAL